MSTNVDLVWKILHECDAHIHSPVSVDALGALRTIRKHAAALYLRMAVTDRLGEAAEEEVEP